MNVLSAQTQSGDVQPTPIDKSLCVEIGVIAHRIDDIEVNSQAVHDRCSDASFNQVQHRISGPIFEQLDEIYLLIGQRIDVIERNLFQVISSTLVRDHNNNFN